MDVALFLTRFLYGMRYRVLLLSFAAAIVVAYFTQFLPKKYSVSTTIFTGVASERGLDNNMKIDYITLNSTFDNIINLTKSKGSLERVSMRLLATNLVYGDLKADNLNIKAENYRKLLDGIPKEILQLVDKNSVENTINNLNEYKQAEPGNYLYGLFSYFHPHYSYNALKNIIVRRIQSSDLIEIAYTIDDPGIATNTVNFMSDELIVAYNRSRYQSVNEVIDYYKKQVDKLKKELSEEEELLSQYNMEHRITNYTDQTKELAASIADFDLTYERTLIRLRTAEAGVKVLDDQMNVQQNLIQTNKDFIRELDNVSTINGKITELEIFHKDDTLINSQKMIQYKEQLKQAEKSINDISNDLNKIKYTKEGIAIEGVVEQWLSDVLTATKARAELKVLDERKQYYHDLQTFYTPVGAVLNQKERTINVLEQAYIDALNQLSAAYQRLNNIKVTTTSLTTVSPATFPLQSDGSKRLFFIVIAFMAVAVFVIGLQGMLELLDRTLRDPLRAKRLTNLPVVGAFLGIKQSQYRGYIKACNRVSATTVTNKLNHLLKKGKKTHINLISINANEGKTFSSKLLEEAWQAQGFRVKTISYNSDFEQFKDISDHMDEYRFRELISQAEADIVLIVYPPLNRYSVPTSLLEEAAATLLVANAKRTWRTSDEEQLQYLLNTIDVKPLLVLNNSKRDYLEDLIGLLPPHTDTHEPSERIRQLGLTSRSTSIK